MRAPASLSLTDDIIKGIKTRSTSGGRVAATKSGAVTTNQAQIASSQDKSFSAQLNAAQLPRNKGKPGDPNNNTTMSAGNSAQPENADDRIDGTVANITAQSANSSPGDNISTANPPISSGGKEESKKTSAADSLSSSMPFADALAMTGLFFGASLQTPLSATPTALSVASATVLSGALLTSQSLPQPALSPVTGQVSSQIQGATVVAERTAPTPLTAFLAGAGSPVSTSSTAGTAQRPASVQGSTMPTDQTAALLAPNGASITNISLIRNETVSGKQASQTDWISLHDESAQGAAMPASSAVSAATMVMPAAPVQTSAATQSVLANTGTSPFREADQPAISAPLTSTSQAAIPVTEAIVPNSADNAATGDDTPSPDDKQSETRSEGKTTVAEVANAIHGLSEFQSLVTTQASSSGGETHHAFAEGNTTASPALGRPEGLSAVDTQNTNLPNTLSMTVQTEDNTPVHLIFEGEGGLATRVILQSDDDLTTQHLAGSRKDLISALNTAGVDTSAMRLDIVTAATNTGDSRQGNQQQDSAGRPDLAGNFMGSNPQQNQQGSSSNARFWPQEPATETVEQRTAISHSQAETLTPAGGVNITA
ncbi:MULTISPECIES: hypothetical protein [Asaia]|uniref:hypothetical protein n=1 Tax=Asaia TaxID=91914 RepID=UPI002FC309F9